MERCQLSDILSRYKNVFQHGLGTLEGYEAKIIVDPEAQPRFYKARSVPYSMRGKVEDELKRLQQKGIIEPIQFAEWAEPIVPVLKSDGKAVRICGDFKLMVNQALKLDRYPIPKIEDLFAQIGEGKARYEPGIPADPARRRVAEVCRDQYPTRVVLV